MNEWETIAWIVGIGAVIFGAVWVIVHDAKKSTEIHIEDVKKGCHARIDRTDHVIDGIIEGCNKKKEQYITTQAFDRFENHQNTKMDGLNNNINHLTTRIDDFIKTARNGVK